MKIDHEKTLDDYPIQWVALKNLKVIWPKSQRPYNPKKAQALADRFDPAKFEPPTITKPNGTGICHVIEGQHRVGAAIIYLNDPNQKIQCRMVDEADPVKAAEIWLGIQEGRTATRPLHEFTIAVEAQRETEVAINNLVKKSGYHVSDNVKGENSISAVKALVKIYNRYGASVLYRTLQICRLLWEGDPKGVDGNLLKGIGMFFNEFHSLDSNHLKKAVLKQYKSPFEFLRACKFGAQQNNNTLEIEIGKLLMVLYNKGLRDQSRKLKRKG